MIWIISIFSIVCTYIFMGIITLNNLLGTRFLRPLTDKEMLYVVFTWPKWL